MSGEGAGEKDRFSLNPLGATANQGRANSWADNASADAATTVPPIAGDETPNSRHLDCQLYGRCVEDRVRSALADTPVVLVIGARRAGKTTLVRALSEPGRDYLTLHDQTVLEAARTDPAGFLRGLDRAALDEVQRVPELLLAIKKAVDEDYRPGRFC